MNDLAIPDLKELRKVELEIIKELDRVCGILGLRYLISYGTLLGAVRHKGFIPWDDDIDVVMFRKDVERLKKEAPSVLDDRYFLQSMESDEGYPSVHLKLRDSTTAFIEEYVADRKMNHGIFIDIFPIDGVPNNRVLRETGWIFLSILGRLALLKSVPSEYETLRMKIAKSAARMIPLSGRSLTLLFSKLTAMVDADRTKYVAFSAWPTYPSSRVVFPRSWFEGTVMMEFEGLILPAPKEFHLLLTQLYGDYMTLPPVENRVVSHKTKIISVSRAYVDFYSDGMHL